MVRMNAAHLFLSTKLGYRLHDRAHIDVRNLDTLVVVNFKSFVDNLGWSLDSKTLMWALACRESLVGTSKATICASFLGFFFKLSILICKSQQFLVVSDLVRRSGFRGVFIKLDGWHQCALGQKRVDLLDELKRCVLLVEDESVDRAEDDRDLSAIKEKL